jgi:hypothetical protein
VAAASTKSQRGVMTAVPKELSLGLTRWTRTRTNLSPYWCGWLHSNCGDAVTRVDDRKRQLKGEDAALTLRYGEVGPKSTVRVSRRKLTRKILPSELATQTSSRKFPPWTVCAILQGFVGTKWSILTTFASSTEFS